MFETHERYPLRNLVIEDLFAANKLLMTLVIALVITMVSTIWVTHQTRQLISEKGALIFEKQTLEREYLNLQLEETTEGNGTKVQARAKIIGMTPISHEQEVLILE